MVETKKKGSKTRTKTKTGGKDRDDEFDTPFGPFEKAMKKMDYCISDLKHSNLVKDRTRASKIYHIGNCTVNKTPTFIPSLD